MELVAIVVLLSLVQYTVFGALVGKARMKYKVEAPAVTGDPVFERYYRVHMNTLESLVLFVPSIFIFAMYVRPDLAAALGVVFIAGRQLYLRAYVKDPKSRELGYVLTILPSAILAIGGIIGAALRLV
ncbi:MAG: MAPEG family protein [Pseudohongiella sp.]|nr:MAPEG family protein [Pseudohongiella sp.]MDO9520275.1 MAPEG family protein [Pseudohongiella sp.]MDP2127080.1 MAPEG family protein [Pseudohongiella sp.]